MVNDNASRLERLTNRLGQLDSGKLDSEIREETRIETERARLKGDATRIKYKAEIVLKNKGTSLTPSAKLKTYVDNKAKIARQNEKAKMAEYRQYLETAIPSREIREKLETLPSNHGYLYHDVLHLGKLPPVKGPFKIFEKIKGVLRSEETVTHADGSKVTSIYEQEGKQVKRLVGRKRREKLGEKWANVKLTEKVIRVTPLKEDFPMTIGKGEVVSLPVWDKQK
jgi:hypothetical protein